MRIIAGNYRSRILKTLEGEQTRPTLDKVRGAVFSSLGYAVEGSFFLDLFGGSGAVGLEAASRGAKQVVICDKERQAIRIIEENVKSLQATQVRVMHQDFQQALVSLAQQGMVFDLVFLDPPYAMHVIEDCIAFMVEHQMLAEDARIVCETGKETTLAEVVSGFMKTKEKTYGKSRISYYRRGEADE
ncbi:MAG: 16S rRNA (guanine(966)-N(2))-methyltransferase RsmD [Erysipelotrichaceae bacterium]